MTPKEVKDLAISAHKTGDSAMALQVVSAIATMDLYINVPKPPSAGEGKIVKCRWADRPCKAGCGILIQPGEDVWWVPNWGISHLPCVGMSLADAGN